MSTVNIPINLRRALQSNLHARNGFYPSAFMQGYMMEELNHALWVRSKCVASHSVPIASIPNGAAATNRWRGAFHAGTHADQLWVRFECMRTGSDIGGTVDPFAKLLVELEDGTDVGTVEFHTQFGLESPSTIHPPSKWATGTFPLRDSGGNIVELTPDTDYYWSLVDDYARTVSMTIFEKSSAADTANGYLPEGPAIGAPILDVDREDPVTLARNAWLLNAAHLLNWSSSTDAEAVTRITATRANLFDQSHTTNTAASPGYRLVNNNNSTERRATDGVPCVLWVYGKVSGVGSGIVSLVDSSANEYLATEIGNTSAQWYKSDPGFLPMTTEKLDLSLIGDGSVTLTVYAVSVAMLEE